MKKILKILGADWAYNLDNYNDDWAGETDSSAQEIRIKSNLDNTLRDKNRQIKETSRHEIIHAYLFESGLSFNSDWATNEEVVDWMAIQFPKMLNTFKEVNAI